MVKTYDHWAFFGICYLLSILFFREKPVTNYNEDARCPLCPMGHFKQVDHKLRLVGKKPNEKVMRKDVVISVPRTSTSIKQDEPSTYIKQEPMDAGI